MYNNHHNYNQLEDLFNISDDSVYTPIFEQPPETFINYPIDDRYPRSLPFPQTLPASNHVYPNMNQHQFYPHMIQPQNTSENLYYHHNANEDVVYNSPPSESVLNSFFCSRANGNSSLPIQFLNPMMKGINLIDNENEMSISPNLFENDIEDSFDVQGPRSRKRKFEYDDEDLEVPEGFKLPASKSPIMEAMAYCAIKRWGIEIVETQDQTDKNPARVIFRVLDFDQYYKFSCIICSKQNPTEDVGSRVKSLRRWFTNFPKKRDRRDNPQFYLEVKSDVSKKVYDMIEKYQCLVNVKKKRRTK